MIGMKRDYRSASFKLIQDSPIAPQLSSY